MSYVGLLEGGEKTLTVQTMLLIFLALGVKASAIIARIERI